jgi:hypothetical protein
MRRRTCRPSTTRIRCIPVCSTPSAVERRLPKRELRFPGWRGRRLSAACKPEISPLTLLGRVEAPSSALALAQRRRLPSTPIVHGAVVRPASLPVPGRTETPACWNSVGPNTPNHARPIGWSRAVTHPLAVHRGSIEARPRRVNGGRAETVGAAHRHATAVHRRVMRCR